MSSQTTGLLLGGFLAAVLYGVSVIFTKASIQGGIGIGWYMLIMSVAIMSVSAFVLFIAPQKPSSLASGLHAAGAGLTWGIGSALVSVALSYYGVPVGKLAPLYNMNTLIAVLLALWIFSEWKQVHVPRLLIGALLIVVGGTLVARS